MDSFFWLLSSVFMTDIFDVIQSDDNQMKPYLSGSFYVPFKREFFRGWAKKISPTICWIKIIFAIFSSNILHENLLNDNKTFIWYGVCGMRCQLEHKDPTFSYLKPYVHSSASIVARSSSFPINEWKERRKNQFCTFHFISFYCMALSSS